MKSFKELSSTRKILIIASGILAGGFFMLDDQDESYAENGGYVYEPGQYSNDGQATAATANQITSNPSSEGGKIVLYDKGLQMPIGTYTIPEDWKLSQDIAVDPNTNESARYHVEISGPQGELIRSLGTTKFGAMSGISFEQGLQRALSGLQLEQLRVGNLEQDPKAQQTLMKLGVYQRLVNSGTQIQCLKAPVSGYYNGQRYEGFVQINKVGSQAGSLTVSGSIAPAGKLASLTKVKTMIDESYSLNPAYEQRREQIQQTVMQRFNNFHNQQMANSSAAHQQRMANNQAAFDASQRNISEMNQLRDDSYNSFMDGMRNSGSYNTNGYSSQDAFIDQIHERSTFNDPWSGQEMHMDGQYDYNYTNGLGDYYRTNDPSFDQNSLQGDWQQIEPEYPY
ncbi:hypothetical protein OKW21_000731 [Catalinimonas alkaloidigena]|uniref:hypothetical protein n=1 Tax=Catalinimonas alkaloidigena TaxID=1075417 RepID=UPI002405EA88|nr:hypothetical protein [Catalinimonas alkaloidigena]MDF9795468.1 hypothetical protein [Catalinimonas alkaloidigena]